jgi:hypothetical protein
VVALNIPCPFFLNCNYNSSYGVFNQNYFYIIKTATTFSASSGGGFTTKFSASSGGGFFNLKKRNSQNGNEILKIIKQI